MLVITENPSYKDAERTFVTDPVAIGATTVNVNSTTNFSVNQYIVLTNPGQEASEITKITSIVSDSQITVNAVKFAHSPDDPVFYSRFNQVRIYRATASGGTYTLLNSVSIQIDSSANRTVYDDTTGGTTNYYKTSYYNDVSTLESALSAEIPGTGYGRTVVSYVIDAVLSEANDKMEQLTTRAEVLRWLNDCELDVHSRRKRWEFWKNDDPLTVTAATRAVALSSLTKAFDRLDFITYRYVSGSTDLTYRLREISLLEINRNTEDNTTAGDNQVQVFALDFENDNLLVDPVPTTSQASRLRIYYYYFPPAITSEGTTLTIPDPRVYHNYCMWRFYSKKDDKRKDDWERRYETSVLNLVRVNKRSSNQLRSFQYHQGSWRDFFKY